MMEEDIVVPEEKKKKKSPFGKILVVLFLFLILVVGGGVYLIYKNTTAENILKKELAIVNLGTKALLSGKEDYSFDIEKDHIINKMIINIKGEGDTLKAINGLAFDIRSSFSLKEEYLDLNVYAKQNDASLGANAYVVGQNIYLEAKDINLPLVVQKDEENLFAILKKELDGETKIQADDINYVVEKLSKYINESLTSSNTSTTNNGIVFTFKYMINNKNNDDPFVKNFVEKVSADKDLLRILETNEENVKKFFDDLETVNITLNYNALKRDYTLIEGELVKKVGEESQTLNFTYEKLLNGDYRFTSGDVVVDIKNVSEGTTFEVFYKKEKQLTATVFDTSDNVFKVKGTITLTYGEQGKEKTDLNYGLTVNFKGDNKVEYTLEVSAKIDKDSFEVKTEVTSEVRHDSIIKGEFNGAKNLESLSQEEMVKVYSTAEEKIKKFELYKALESYYNQLMQSAQQSTTM